MPDLEIRQPEFFYRICRSLTKNKERIQKLQKKGDSWYFYQNELDRACFHHDMAYGDFKHLPRKKQKTYYN